MKDGSKYAFFDDQKWPVLYVKFRREMPTHQEFDKYLKEFSCYLNRKEKHYSIIDASESKYLQAELRIKQAKWLKENDHLLREYTLGTAYVIPNVLISFVLKGVFMIQPPSTPYTIVGSIDKAEEWVMQSKNKVIKRISIG